MLKDQVAIITGSARGIGKEIAMLYVKNGASVVINYPTENEKEVAENTVEEILTAGGKAVAIKANVAVFDEAKSLIDETIKAFGQIDILVNNAGITRDTLLMRMSESEFDAVINVNLKGTFNCTKHAIRAMFKKGGSIINIASVVGLNGNVGQCNYAASKAGIVGFTKTVAKEYASKNIRANAIAPGFIATDMTSVLKDSVKEEISKGIPMKRLGVAEEVAKVALFLASDLASYVTGEVVRVDGGMAM